MKHLYPNCLSFSSYLKGALVTFFLTCSTLIYSQTLNFNAPTIESGTDQQVGCVYRFSSITANGKVDALVTIDSLIGVSVYGIDATPSGTSSTAFQPQLQSSGGVGYHYAVFTVTFVTAGTTYPTPVTDFSSVFMGIDGSNQIREMNSITIPNATWQYVSSNPKVEVTQDGNTYTGIATSTSPTGGETINDTDSSQMFRVSSPLTTSFSMRIGYYQDQPGWKGIDLFSINIMGGELQNAVLPLNLLSFTAKLTNEKVSLSWSTSKEENVSHYIIEKSYNNESYEQAALVFPAEVSLTVNNYMYQDAIKNTASSVIYYRLKMIDKDGKYRYSAIRMVKTTESTEAARIVTYPNPVVNDLHISLPQNWQNKTVNCMLLNASGLIIKSLTIQQAGLTATIIMREVPAGMYFVKAISGKEMCTQTIVKSSN
jgi:hypothetical protein